MTNNKGRMQAGDRVELDDILVHRKAEKRDRMRVSTNPCLLRQRSALNILFFVSYLPTQNERQSSMHARHEYEQHLYAENTAGCQYCEEHFAR